MKLQQLRYIWEVAHHDLNVSATAQVLYTSQPGISKQIRLLEDELGVEIFARNGKHLTNITPAGQVILKIAGDVLRKIDTIKQAAQEFNNDKKGTLTVGTTHTQARYALPNLVKQFIAKYPEVALRIHQGTPNQIAEMAANGIVDFAIATEELENFHDLIVMPCYRWNRSILVPKNHTLAQKSAITLEELASNPLVTYSFGSTGRTQLDQAFKARGLAPKVVLTATDADVIKTYVKVGLGAGIIASMAVLQSDHTDFAVINASHLFEDSVTHIGCRKGAYLRGFAYDFFQHFAPHLTAAIVDQALQCHSKVEVEALFQNVELSLH